MNISKPAGFFLQALGAGLIFFGIGVFYHYQLMPDAELIGVILIVSWFGAPGLALLWFGRHPYVKAREEERKFRRDLLEAFSERRGTDPDPMAMFRKAKR